MKFFQLLSTGFLLFCLNQNITAQIDSLGTDDELTFAKPDLDPDIKFGIKMGMAINTIVGSENSNGRPAFGLIGGGYIRKKLNDKSWVQTELFVSYRGSRFKATTQEYSRIKLLYVDLPLLYMRAFKKSENRWFAGIQGSILVSPNMYLSGQQIPISANLKLNRYDILPVAGYLYQMDFIALQTCIKYGLLNLNTGNEWPSSAKPLNKNGTMHNISFELNILF